jgi:hypothetical protein
MDISWLDNFIFLFEKIKERFLIWVKKPSFI